MVDNYVKYNLTSCQRSVTAHLWAGILPLRIETGWFRNVKTKLEDTIDFVLCVTYKKSRVKYSFCLNVPVMHILDSHGYMFMKNMNILTLWMLMTNFASFLRSFIILCPSLSRTVLITEKITICHLNVFVYIKWDSVEFVYVWMLATYLFMDWLVIWWHCTCKPIGLGPNVNLFVNCIFVSV